MLGLIIQNRLTFAYLKGIGHGLRWDCEDDEWRLSFRKNSTYKLENQTATGTLFGYTLCTINEGNVNKLLANGYVQYGNPTLN